MPRDPGVATLASLAPPEETWLSRLPGPPLCWGGAKGRGCKCRRAQTRPLAGKVRGVASREPRIPKAEAAGVSQRSARREMLLMLRSPPISRGGGGISVGWRLLSAHRRFWATQTRVAPAVSSSSPAWLKPENGD